MNAKQLIDFADKYAYEPNMFNDLERTLDERRQRLELFREAAEHQNEG